MEIIVSNSREELGKKAARKGAELIRNAISERGDVNIIVATGASQFEILKELVKENIDWSKVTGFHLDEYIGIPRTHPASFRKYLKERLVDIISPKEFHYVNGDIDPAGECTRLGRIISKYPVDVAFIGIGENSHLAFNDPPADFETEEPRSEEHTSELQSHSFISYAVFCLKKKKKHHIISFVPENFLYHTTQQTARAVLE